MTDVYKVILADDSTMTVHVTCGMFLYDEIENQCHREGRIIDEVIDFKFQCAIFEGEN